MTLIEIMIVLAIIGLMVLMLPAVIKRARKSDLRGDAAHLAAAMRAGYDRAAATATHHRLVIDLEQDTFQLESCEGPIRMVRSIDEAHAAEAQAIEAQAAKPPEGPPPIDLSGSGGSGAPAPVMPQAGSEVGASAAPLPCTPLKGKLGELQPLAKGSGISFKEVFVSHLDQPASEGKATINFFPAGRSERAVVTLTDKDDHVYSVRLHAITGRAQVIEGEYHRPEDVVQQASEAESVR
jgi:Tfp pilus assembly protein PilE